MKKSLVVFRMDNKEVETYQQKKRRLFGRFHHMATYLEELGCLLNVEKREDDIWSIVKSDAFVEKAKGLEWTLLFKDVFPFKNKELLQEVLKNYVEDWNVPYSLFISHSEYCGLVSISSLYEINWYLYFPDEIICLTRMDYKEHIIVDYYKEDDEELIEVEIKKSL